MESSRVGFWKARTMGPAWPHRVGGKDTAPSLGDVDAGRGSVGIKHDVAFAAEFDQELVLHGVGSGWLLMLGKAGRHGLSVSEAKTPLRALS